VSEAHVGWDGPPDGWICLNTDRASKDNPGPAGGGGVLRGCRGDWMCGFSEGMGVCTAMKAKIKAVFRGLRLAKDMKIPKLWV